MNNLIRKIVNIIFYYTGLYNILKYKNRKKIKVLMYHGVQEEKTAFSPDDSSLIISVKNFEKQIKFLSKSYNIISAYDLINHIKKKMPLPVNSVVITFDDGYKNNYTSAFPILRKYKAKALVFLITEYIDTLKINWLDRFHYLLKKININKVVKEFIKKFPEYQHLTELKCRNYVMEQIIYLLIFKIDENQRTEFLKNLFAKFKININNKKLDRLYLSWKEIEEMDDAGILFGNHTSTHPVLSLLDSNKVRKEFSESKNKIEIKLNKAIDLFAYPYGKENSFNVKIKRMLIDQGFLCAFSSIEGFNTGDSDLYELKRTCIFDEPLYYFKLRIEGFEGIIERLYHKLRSCLKTNSYLY